MIICIFCPSQIHPFQPALNLLVRMLKKNIKSHTFISMSVQRGDGARGVQWITKMSVKWSFFYALPKSVCICVPIVVMIVTL